MPARNIAQQLRQLNEVLRVGWDGPRRVHGSVVHIDIIDGRVWLQYNGTPRAIGEELVAAGIPREAMVLGFQPPHVRRYTEFGDAEEPGYASLPDSPPGGRENENTSTEQPVWMSTPG
jgi:hypothetical protein